MADRYRIIVKGGKRLEKGFKVTASSLLDFSEHFESISIDFFKSNKHLIFRNTPGMYRDLKESTKRNKRRRHVTVYPVLVDSGRLKRSLTNRKDREAVLNIKKRRMIMGTNVPYARYLQTGTSEMVARPPVMVDIERRLFRWKRIIRNAVDQNIKRNIKK